MRTLTMKEKKRLEIKPQEARENRHKSHSHQGRGAGSKFYDLTILADLLLESDAITCHPLLVSCCG